MNFLAILYYTVKSIIPAMTMMLLALSADGFISSKQPTTKPNHEPITLVEQPRWPEGAGGSLCDWFNTQGESTAASGLWHTSIGIKECFKAHHYSIDTKGNRNRGTNATDKGTKYRWK